MIEFEGSLIWQAWFYNGKQFCLSEEGYTFVVSAGEQIRLSHVNELEDMAQASPHGWASDY